MALGSMPIGECDDVRCRARRWDVPTRAASSGWTNSQFARLFGESGKSCSQLSSSSTVTAAIARSPKFRLKCDRRNSRSSMYSDERPSPRFASTTSAGSRVTIVLQRRTRSFSVFGQGPLRGDKVRHLALRQSNGFATVALKQRLLPQALCVSPGTGPEKLASTAESTKIELKFIL